MRVLLAVIVLVSFASRSAAQDIRLGAKADIETSILAGTLAALAEEAGADAETGVVNAASAVVFEAIANGEIDAYVEYTGTLIGATLSGENLADVEELRDALRTRGLAMSEPLGFNNTYALAVTRETSERLGLTTSSDLANHPHLSVGVSTEWFGRDDGWPSLKSAYGLGNSDVTPLTEHRFLYEALINGRVDVIEVYTTEAAIEANDLVVLEDDRGFFPQYEAFVLYRQELEETAPAVVESWRQLESRLDEEAMTALNARVEIGKERPVDVGTDYAREVFATTFVAEGSTRAGRIATYTLEHLLLVGAAMAMAIVVAVPLGVVAAKSAAGGRIVLNVVGIIQTIPSLALLVFMIPLLGLKEWPAIVALFLYALLPIVANTHAGLIGIARPVRESAEALGLTGWQRLTRIELPLALPNILAGIKTSAVITVGFATLGAFIGAGGYGRPIFDGFINGNTAQLLEGAVPAALLAVAVQFGLGLVSRLVVSRGLTA